LLLPLLLPLLVLAVILSEAKDPDTLNITQTVRTLFNHEPAFALAVAIVFAVAFPSNSKKTSKIACQAPKPPNQLIPNRIELA
jgi:hypothetical protein